MTAKNCQKTLYSESEELYYKYVYAHKEFVLMTGSLPVLKKITDIVADMHDSADIHKNNTEGMEYNTNIRKKKLK